MKLYTILKNKTGVVRTSLCIEDITLSPNLVDYGLMEKREYEQEEYLVFRDAIPVPKFNRFYASRIKNHKDPYLVDLCVRLLYLNPSPDALMIKKLAEHIILRFSRIEMKPSNVKSSELIATPVLTFEQVEMAIHSAMFPDYRPTTGVYALFHRDSGLEPSERGSLHMRVRHDAASDHLGEAIHIVAEQLMDSYQYLKVTTSKIENTKVIKTKKGPATVRTIDKHMKDKTRSAISDHNVAATLNTIISHEKYEHFKSLPAGSLDFICNELGVSKSAAVEFRKLKSKEDDNNREL